jgi:hypothetical protein
VPDELEVKRHQFIIKDIGPSIDDQKLFGYMRNNLDISVIGTQKEDPTTFVVTVEGEEDLKRALEDEFITYRGSKLPVSLYTGAKYVVSLQDVSEHLTESRLSEHIQETFDITPKKTTISKATRTATLELNFDKEKQLLLEEGFLKYKGTKVCRDQTYCNNCFKMAFVEAVTKSTMVLVYMTKAVDLAEFGNQWNDSFGFSIVGRSSINIATHEAWIEVKPEELDRVKKEDFFAMDGEQVSHVTQNVI